MRKLMFTVAAVAIAIVATGYVVLSHGLAADRAPGRIETFVARRLVLLSIPSADRSAANPYAADPGAWRQAVDHFGEHCSICHGADGRGQSEFGPRMYPPVPDLTSVDIQRFSDGALSSIIRNGVRWTGMPAFRSTDSDEEIWKLVSLIRRLPTLSPADLRPQHPEDDHDHRQAATDHAAATIAIDGTSFQPDETTVAVGGMVMWANKDPFPHNVVSKPGGIHSGDIEPDGAWRFRATRRGTFEYVCTLHPGMHGVLRVK